MLLDAADEAGVIVIDLLVTLAPGEHHLGRVDDNDVVTAIDVRSVGRKMLAAQPHRHQSRKATDNQTGCVDQHPLLRDFGRLCRKCRHVRISMKRVDPRDGAELACL